MLLTRGDRIWSTSGRGAGVDLLGIGCGGAVGYGDVLQHDDDGRQDAAGGGCGGCDAEHFPWILKVVVCYCWRC